MWLNRENELYFAFILYSSIFLWNCNLPCLHALSHLVILINASSSYFCALSSYYSPPILGHFFMSLSPSIDFGEKISLKRFDIFSFGHGAFSLTTVLRIDHYSTQLLQLCIDWTTASCVRFLFDSVSVFEFCEFISSFPHEFSSFLLQALPPADFLLYEYFPAFSDFRFLSTLRRPSFVLQAPHPLLIKYVSARFSFLSPKLGSSCPVDSIQSGRICPSVLRRMRSTDKFSFFAYQIWRTICPR